MVREKAKAIAVATDFNTSFSRQVPGLQLAIDSTSLGEFKVCPRKYLYSIIFGYQPREQSIHLTFGLLIHKARELYEHFRVAGQGHEEALELVVEWAMQATWDKDLGRGQLTAHPLKNRLTLIRSIVWYLDEFGNNDPLETIRLANGKPAVELSFRFESGFKTHAGEAIVFCGHLDRIARMGEAIFICDIKTTGRTISPHFFNEFSPGNQFSMYSLAGRVAFATEVQGVVVDGLQIAAGFTRGLRGLVFRPPGVLDEYLAASGWWLQQMEDCAEKQSWPQNDKSCGMFGGCAFQKVCSRSPGSRQLVLDSDFTRRVWDPLQTRET